MNKLYRGILNYYQGEYFIFKIQFQRPDFFLRYKTFISSYYYYYFHIDGHLNIIFNGIQCTPYSYIRLGYYKNRLKNINSI